MSRPLTRARLLDGSRRSKLIALALLLVVAAVFALGALSGELRDGAPDASRCSALQHEFEIANEQLYERLDVGLRGDAELSRMQDVSKRLRALGC